MLLLKSILKTNYDVPAPWGIYFQDSATPQMEGLVELHDNIMYYLVMILFAVAWILLSIIRNYVETKSSISHKFLNHGTLIELIWTITPALVLIAIAFPSFRLLYMLDEVVTPIMTIKVIGHQWYWSYEYADFINENDESIDFDSYMVPDNDLEVGQLRLLEVDNKIVVPSNAHIRLVVTSTDVIHDFAVPSLGVKLDACPGRLNQVSFLAERTGVFYGQCSELCGVYHGFMPIVVEAVPSQDFLIWVESQS